MNEPKLSVEETWDVIAESFDTTRKKPWQPTQIFIEKLSKKDRVLDLSCGNGRHLLPAAKKCSQIIGLDISKNLLKLTQEKIQKNKLTNTTLIHATATQLPFSDNSFNKILFIASLHCIPQRKNRLLALQEIQRVLKPGGTAQISVWSKWQDKYRVYFIKQFFKRKKTKEFGDITIHWRQHKLDIPRFYHLYSKREIIHDIKKTKLNILTTNKIKLKSHYFPDNFFVVVKK